MIWAGLAVFASGFAVEASVTYAPRLVELRTPSLVLALLGVMIMQSWASGRTARRD